MCNFHFFFFSFAFYGTERRLGPRLHCWDTTDLESYIKMKTNPKKAVNKRTPYTNSSIGFVLPSNHGSYLKLIHAVTYQSGTHSSLVMVPFIQRCYKIIHACSGVLVCVCVCVGEVVGRGVKSVNYRTYYQEQLTISRITLRREKKSDFHSKTAMTS